MPSRNSWLTRTMLAAGLGCVLAGNGIAQSRSSEWLSNAWQTEDGLPDNTVSGVLQTLDGYLWVATFGGLVRFDGARFVEFSPVNIPEVPNRVVQTEFLDSRGRLWLGMDRGPIVCVDSASARVLTVTNGLPDVRINSVAEDAEGSIWIGYADGGLFRLKGEQATRMNPGQTKSSGFNRGCFVIGDTKGRIWFAAAGGVWAFQNSQLQAVVPASDSEVRLGAARASGVWVCAGPRLLKIDAEHSTIDRAVLPFARDDVEPTCLLEDTRGVVWIGTDTGGVFRWDGTRTESIPTSHREISALMEDREGNIWVGTAGGGLNRLRPRPVQLLGVETGLPFESVRSACEDAGHHVWIVTQNGMVAQQQGTKWIKISSEREWPGGHATCVSSDGSSGVWIGTNNRGLLRYVDKKYQSIRKIDGLTSDFIRSLLLSSSGDLWIGTDSPNGVQRLGKSGIQTFEMPHRARFVRAMAEDSTHTIWIGTADGQLLRVDGDRLLNIEGLFHSQALSIRALHATDDGSLWIGYASWGLGRLNRGHYSRITTAEGLHDDYISQIVSDGRGWMWFAGNRGIFRVRSDELEAAANGHGNQVRSIVYGRGEGLPSLQASFDYSPGALRTHDGTVCIPTRNGLAVARPQSIPNNTAPPPMAIERVVVDGKTVARYDSHSPLLAQTEDELVELHSPDALLKLAPNHRKIEFEFTALSLVAPANVHFRYRLDGLDEDWVEAHAQRSATYSRLPAGDYHFRVIACNNDGVWNNSGASMHLSVPPFFWRRWWVQLLILGGFTLGVIGVARFILFRRVRLEMRRLEQQAALHRERARIAKDIHDDLGANLTQIALLGELAHQDRAVPEKSGERLERISAAARQSIHALDEIVWAVNPRNDTLVHLIDYAGQFAFDYLRLAGVRCRLDFPDQIPAIEVSTDLRHNLFLVVKEALHNIVKHAHASEVWLRVSATPDAVNILIEDNGVGFEKGNEGAGSDGLRNIHNRVKEIGGECSIESHTGRGTVISVTVPWPKQ